MTAKRYAVLDADGVVINHILIDDPMPKGYWPGYGASLVPLEPVDLSDGGAGIEVIKLDLSTIPQIGDSLDSGTGEVVKFVPQPITDEKGVISMSAPAVMMVQDVAPEIDASVTDNTGLDSDMSEVK